MASYISTAEAVAEESEVVRQTPRTVEEEPLLHHLPEGVHATYGSLPSPIEVLTILYSAALSAMSSTCSEPSWFFPLAVVQGWREVSIPGIFDFAMKAVLFASMSKVLLDEAFCSPSRVSTDTLLEQYFLPSRLSAYDKYSVRLPNGSEGTSLGVHYLESRSVHEAPQFDALYLQHGFGASSLSWLPAMQPLTKSLRAKVGLAHDAVGFGFTDRPKDLEWYTHEASAAIGNEILMQKVNANAEQEGSPKSVALMGHSMGALSALQMALTLPKETSKFVVLASPALGVRQCCAGKKASSSPVKKQASVLEEMAYPLASFALRRLVGSENFWKTGLQSLWGNPKKVTESDVLRFQWPSIGAGWERGLIDFARAQGLPSSETDESLLQKVVDLPNTKVFVVLGSEDRITPSKQMRQFLDAFPQVEVVEMEGVGHDSFEENTEAFVGHVEEFLAKWQSLQTKDS